MSVRFPYFFFQSSGPPRDLHSFPTRRSSDLIAQFPVSKEFRDFDLIQVRVLRAFLNELLQGSDSRGRILGLERLHRSEEHTSELQSLTNLVCRLLLEKKKNKIKHIK